MAGPILPGAGLFRVDAALVEGGGDRETSSALVRVRHASELGIPLAPVTVLRWGRLELGPVSFYDPVAEPVATVRVQRGPLSARDATGLVTTSSGSPAQLAGAPLVVADRDDAVGAWFAARDLRQWDPLTSIGSELLRPGRWRASSTTSEQPIDRIDEVLAGFGHPLWSEGTPVSRARDGLASWWPAVQTLLDDPSVDDLVHARLGEHAAGATGRADVEFGGWLAALGADPAAAALLGTMGLVDGLGASTRGSVDVVCAIAVFALPKDARGGVPDLVRDWASRTASDQAEARCRLLGEHAGLEDTREGLAYTHDFVHLWAPAAVVPLPDPPRPARLRPAAVPLGPRSTAVEVKDHQGSPVAVYRHAEDDERRDVLLLTSRGVVTDDAWQADPPVHADYKVWVQDLWGRWSDPAHAGVSAPVPPTASPNVDVEFLPDRVDPSAAGLRVPGRVRMRAFVTASPLGGFPVLSVRVDLAGAAVSAADLQPEPLRPAEVSADDTGARWWSAEIDVRATSPAEVVPVTATFTAATINGPLAPQVRRVTAVDGRPIHVDATNDSLLFAGARRPDGTCEVDLRLTSAVPPGVTFRLYASDELALGPAPSADELRAPRHLRVNRLLDRVDRSVYVRVPDTTVTTDGATVRVRLPVPGRSPALRVLQLVPVTAGGVETPSSMCRAFVVAAPLDDRPGTPALVVSSVAPRTLTATVTLVHPTTWGDWPAELARRGRTGTDPIPAQVLWAPAGTDAGSATLAASVDLVPDPPVGPFSALHSWRGTVSIAAPASLPPFERLRLWARAAWPAEPAGAPGSSVASGSVRGRWSDVQSQPSEWSPLSSGVDVRVVEPDLTVVVTLAPDRRHWLLDLPENLDPAGPGWRVLWSDADGRNRGEQLTYGGPLTIPVPPGAVGPALTGWQFSVMAPDGHVLPLVRT